MLTIYEGADDVEGHLYVLTNRDCSWWTCLVIATDYGDAWDQFLLTSDYAEKNDNRRDWHIEEIAWTKGVILDG